MGPSLAIAATLACLAGRALAERAIVVDAAGAPFSPRELADALRVRVARDGAPLHVRVTATERGVRVEVLGAAREIELGALTGAAAARLVALAADDMLLEDLATPPALAHPTRSRAALAFAAGAAAWDAPFPNAFASASLQRGRWLIAVDAGAGSIVGGNVQLIAGIARLSGGVRAGAFDVRAGASIAPFWVTTGAGDTSIAFGGGASVRAHLPLGRSVELVPVGGLDAFANRTHYSIAGMPAFTTPFVSPWLALELEVGL